ncbi:MAG: Gfo/Idh/MocA family oxidoreductase [Planctomycetota bacterium]
MIGNEGGLDRRGFLRRASVGAAALTPYHAWTSRAFANREKNDRPRIGCIGTGSMGTVDARDHARFGDVVAVCDVDSRHMLRAKHDDAIGKGYADAYEDYRRVLDRSDVDVVSVVTPDHWHVKIAIEALQAGKHVFVQKPLTLTLEENRLIREACKKHADQTFFIGTQQRSSKDLFLRAVNMVQKGLLGDIKKVVAGIDGAPTGGPFPVEAPPAELDWHMWLGPAPLVDYRRRRCHYEFRWWYEYSGGKFTDWGAHHVDIATWALGFDGEGQGPVEVDGSDAKHPVAFEDGYPTVDDSYNTSHDFNVVCRYASGQELHVTSRGSNGVLFEGTKGRLFVNRKKITGKPIEEEWDKDQFGEEDLVRLYRGKPYEGHKENFYRCIREGGLPVSDVYSHVQTMNTCHLAAVAARLGRAVQWDPAAEAFVGDEQAQALASRESRAGFEIPRVG